MLSRPGCLARGAEDLQERMSKATERAEACKSGSVPEINGIRDPNSSEIRARAEAAVREREAKSKPKVPPARRRTTSSTVSNRWYPRPRGNWVWDKNA